jgi:hypothetical protein
MLCSRILYVIFSFRKSATARCRPREPRLHLADIGLLAVGHVHHDHLLGREPERQRAAWFSMRMPMKRSIEPTMARCSMTGVLAGVVLVDELRAEAAAAC